MIQKRWCSLSTKVSRPFYDIVKIRAYKMLIFFTIYETMFENAITNLPITYSDKTKMPGKR